MVYAGQEVGEKGMDAEGFSGVDGRTTIFDYWMVDTIRREFFDRRRLKQDERKLFDYYCKIMRMANEEKAFYEGSTFDLMYVNPHLANKQFAFLRKAGTDVILVVANFDDQPVTAQVNIPSHAFEYLQIPQRQFSAVDLLSGEKTRGKLSADSPMAVVVPANGGCVLKLTL